MKLNLLHDSKERWLRDFVQYTLNLGEFRFEINEIGFSIYCSSGILFVFIISCLSNNFHQKRKEINLLYTLFCAVASSNHHRNRTEHIFAIIFYFARCCIVDSCIQFCLFIEEIQSIYETLMFYRRKKRTKETHQ